jgi:type IV secretory pathway TrbD component
MSYIASPAEARVVRGHPVHAALVRPVLFAGVEQSVLALEATVALALVLGVGPHITTVLLAAIIIGVLHPALARATAREPLIVPIYLRSLAARDYYAPHSALHAPSLPVRPSVPPVR